MRIMYITNVDLSKSFGGSLGCRKFIEGIKQLYYMGKIEDYRVVWRCQAGTGVLNTNTDNKFIAVRSSLPKCLKRILNRMKGNLNDMVLEYRTITKIVKTFSPDIIILQNSFLGDFAAIVKKLFPSIKLIAHFDNFEIEFFEFYLRKHRTATRFLRLILDGRIIKRLEHKYLTNADVIVFLTQKDMSSIQSFYGMDVKKYVIFPVLIEDPRVDFDTIHLRREKGTIRVTFTGSLDYYPNIQAALFIESIYDDLYRIVEKNMNSKALEVIIAGRNPVKDLSYSLRKSRIIPNPSASEMKELLANSDVYISPVFEGSGMKVKVAEALSYGLPVIASEHSLIGYEKLLKLNGYVYKFSNKNELLYAFRNVILELNNIEGKERIYRKNYTLFSKYYSLQNAATYLLKAIKLLQ